MKLAGKPGVEEPYAGVDAEAGDEILARANPPPSYLRKRRGEAPLRYSPRYFFKVRRSAIHLAFLKVPKLLILFLSLLKSS
jgi:hypothetical protein